MNAGFSVPIQKESVEYLSDVFKQYREVASMDTIENPVIHMYAVEDTYDENGELHGYIDSLFCHYHYYDTKNKIAYKPKRKHDAIFFSDGVTVSNVKLFKDGSTLVQLNSGKYRIQQGTAVFLYLMD